MLQKFQLALKDYLTLGNASLGFLSIRFTFLQAPLYFPAFLIFGAAILDFLDGTIARKSKPNLFGKNLDSLADAVSFGAAPAIFSLYYFDSFFVGLASFSYVLAGLIRLAKFNVQKEKGIYYGLPIPIAAIFVVVFSILIPSMAFFFLLLASFLMLADFKLNKFKFAL